jgi:hypothetical protein
MKGGVAVHILQPRDNICHQRVNASKLSYRLSARYTSKPCAVARISANRKELAYRSVDIEIRTPDRIRRQERLHRLCPSTQFSHVRGE